MLFTLNRGCLSGGKYPLKNTGSSISKTLHFKIIWGHDPGEGGILYKLLGGYVPLGL